MGTIKVEVIVGKRETGHVVMLEEELGDDMVSQAAAMITTCKAGMEEYLRENGAVPPEGGCDMVTLGIETGDLSMIEKAQVGAEVFAGSEKKSTEGAEREKLDGVVFHDPPSAFDRFLVAGPDKTLSNRLGRIGKKIQAKFPSYKPTTVEDFESKIPEGEYKVTRERKGGGGSPVFGKRDPIRPLTWFMERIGKTVTRERSKHDLPMPYQHPENPQKPGWFLIIINGEAAAIAMHGFQKKLGYAYEDAE